MSEIKLALETRTLTGKKLKALRAEDKIPSVIYGQGDPVLAQSDYNATEKVLKAAGYHSTIDLDVTGKKSMAIVKNIDLDPVSRKIVNVEFQAVSADKAVEATAPIVIEGYEGSEASKLHFVLAQVIEEIDVKAKPADLPKELTISAEQLAKVNAVKITIADLKLPKGVELADKELDQEQLIAHVYDPAAEAAAREAKEAEAAAESAEEAPAEGEKAEEKAE